MEHRAIELAIEAIKHKNQITNIESDILETWEDYKRQPFDQEIAQSRIITNNMRYPDIYISIDSMPHSVSIPFNTMTENDFKFTLINQIIFLLPKANKDEVDTDTK